MEGFKIHIVHLSKQKHDYHFSVDESFFVHYGQQILTTGNFEVDVVLDKHETFMDAQFSINGTAPLVCDRSLEVFQQPFQINKKVIFKFGPEEKEVSEDVVIISLDREKIDVGQYIYEFIVLAMPAKRLHPRFDAEDADTFVYLSKEKKEIDPRWEALKKLKNNQS